MVSAPSSPSFLREQSRKPTLPLHACAGDALRVCFNTVAILFLMDIDNQTFDFALPEAVRSLVEESGHVELSDAQAAGLARTKPIHIFLIVATVLGSVAVGGAYGEAGFLAALFFPSLAFFLAGAAEAFGAGRSGVEVCKEIAKTAGAALLGGVGCAVLAVLAKD